MPLLTIRHRKSSILPTPFFVLVNHEPVGLSRGGDVHIGLAEGRHCIGARVCIPLGKWQPGVQGEVEVEGANEHVVLEFSSRERVWNMLFNIDLVLWLASFSFTLPHPWHTVYEVASNGFFLLWGIQVWLRRNRFFHFREVSRTALHLPPE